MSSRVTIMISDSNDKKLRSLQSDLIKKYTRSFSYSSVLNAVLDGDYKLK